MRYVEDGDEECEEYDEEDDVESGLRMNRYTNVADNSDGARDIKNSTLLAEEFEK